VLKIGKLLHLVPKYPALSGIFMGKGLTKWISIKINFILARSDSTKIDLFQLFLGFEPLHCGYLVH
jgi:hypothetical protein